MKTTKIIATSLVALTALSGIVSSAKAADATYGKIVDSEATAQLTAGSIDPTDPSKGNIGIVQAPNFEFVAKEVGEAFDPIDGTVTKADAKAVDNALVIRDYRGTAEGWNVTVAASKFTGYTDDTYATEATAATASVASAVGITLPTGIANVTTGFNAVDKTALVQTPTSALNTKGQEILKAAATDTLGNGQTNVFYNQATLGMPDSALASYYKATITWTLSDTMV